MMLVQELGKVLSEVAEKWRITPAQTPVLICGDLNSLPDSGLFVVL
jgi:endonuclease/exonuclease/phosphatase family metal-dependent hydrolase